MHGIFRGSIGNTGFINRVWGKITSTSNTQATYKKRLNLINGFDQRRHIQMCVNPFCQGHSAGMTDNFFDGSLIDMCFGEQRNCGVTAAVGCVINLKTKHQRLENIVIVHMIGKMLTIKRMNQIFAVRAVMEPAFIEREDFIGNRNLADSIFCFTVYDIKILFGQMDIFFFQIQKFRDTDTVVDEQQDSLTLGIILVFPKHGNFGI